MRRKYSRDAEEYPSPQTVKQQTCINNMLAVVPSSGCASLDIICICVDSNFTLGVRDCANESCSSASDASDTITFIIAYCLGKEITLQGLLNVPNRADGL